MVQKHVRMEMCVTSDGARVELIVMSYQAPLRPQSTRSVIKTYQKLAFASFVDHQGDKTQQQISERH